MQSLNGQTVVIAGGSGFLGTSLAYHLTEANAKVVVLSRSKPKADFPWQHRPWDGRTLGDWAASLEEAGALVNLAGRSVNCVKTPDHQDEILRSRVESTSVLGQALRQVDHPPKVWVQMSTAHIYGDPPTAVCDESSPFGIGFAPTIGKAWEEAFNACLLPEQRGVLLRTSFVVGRNRGAGGGALTFLGGLARFGLGGRVGCGTQGMSWIHEADLNRIVEQAISDPSMTGAYITSAPKPESQVDFMRALRRAVGMPIGLPAFSWMVKIAAPLLLRTDPELALYGRYVVPSRLQEMGFEFRFPTLEPALRDLYRR